MNKADKIIKRLREHPRVKDKDDPIGVIGVSCKDVKVDEQNGNNDVVAIVTTDDIDLDDEVIDPAGLSFDYLQANEFFFVDHVYDTKTHTAGALRGPLGAWPSTKDQKGWRARIRMIDNEAGNAVKQLIREAGHIGLSIGFYPTDRGPLTEEEQKRYTRNGKTPTSIVRSAEVFEVSFTALPCNVSCQGQFVSGGDSEVRALRTLVADGKVDGKVAATLFGVAPNHPLKVLTLGGVVTKPVV
jgi:hypothetical protein